MKNNSEEKKRKKFIFLIIIVSALYYLCVFTDKLDLSILSNPQNNDIHFNLITVNSIFVGFLFSSLALVLGLNSISSIQRLEKGGFMDNIYFNLIFGITTSFTSIFISLFMIFCRNIINADILINTIVPSVELLLLIFTIIIFIKSVVDVKFVIKSVRRSVKKSMPDEEELQETLNLIK